MLPSLYSPQNRTVGSTVGGAGGGLPDAGMRLQAVRAVDGLANGRGMEEAVRRAVGPADSGGTPVADARRDGRLRPPCGRVGGRPPRNHSRPPGFYPRVSPDFRGRPDYPG